MGSAETFTSVASFEFAYFSAPTSAQSLFMSLHFFSAGVASFLSQALIAILSRIYENKDTDFDFNVSTLAFKSYQSFLFSTH